MDRRCPLLGRKPRPAFPNGDISPDSNSTVEAGEQLWYGNGEEYLTDDDVTPEQPISKKCIAVGDIIPYGTRLYIGFNNIFRFRDVGEKSRILIVGVLGSFTPLCWNRHFLQVLTKIRYFEERGIEFICCVSTNDSFTQGAWATYLGCYDRVLMLGDTTNNFTRALGMEVVVPFLDNNIRSKRYIIYAEDMIVTKIIVSSQDDVPKEWCCEHLLVQSSESEETEESDTDSGPTQPWESKD